MYIFDTCSFRALFTFYPKRFPTLWKLFEQVIQAGKLHSVSEVLQELKNQIHKDTSALQWIENNKDLFVSPSSEEALFIMNKLFIDKNGHFKNIVEKDKVLRGGSCADPFILASAYVKQATVVTQEVFKPNSVKIPFICQHYNINCLNLEKFMEEQNWEF